VNSFTQCGTGISMINPAVQATPDIFNFAPNSFFTVATSPFAVYARDFNNSNAPFVRQLNGGIQQQITNKLAFEVAYVGTSAKQLPVVFNGNFATENNTGPYFGGSYDGPFPGCSPAFNAGCAAVNGPGPSGNFNFFPIYTMTHQAESSYHSLMVRAKVADWNGLRFNAAYSLSKSQDNASSGFYPTVPNSLRNFLLQQITQTALDQFDCIYVPQSFCGAIDLSGFTVGFPATVPLPQIDFSTGAVTTTGLRPPLVTPYLIPQDPLTFLNNDIGRSDFHSKHRFVLDYTWDVPAKAWGWPSWMENFQISGIFTGQTGQPFSIFTGPLLGQVTQRAIATGPVEVTNSPGFAIDPSNLRVPTSGMVDPATLTFIPDFCAFAPQNFPVFLASQFQPQPGVACAGSTRRNEFTGPNFINFDLAVQKGFQIFGEGRTLTLRAELYNLTSRANFYNPISQLSTDGQTVSPNFGKIKSARDPRQIQFAVRFNW